MLKAGYNFAGKYHFCSSKTTTMTQQVTLEAEQVTEVSIRVKTTERECPRCDAVLVLNDNEQCYECLNCGYIDCGDD